MALSFLRSRVALERQMASDRSLSYRHFYRVFFLGSIDAILTVPISAFQLWVNIAKDGPIQPWKGWANVHFNFSRIGQIPASLWSLDTWSIFTVRWNQWLCTFCAFVFLCFFGFTEDARRSYYRTLRNVMRKVGLGSGLRTPRVKICSAYLFPPFHRRVRLTESAYTSIASY